MSLEQVTNIDFKELSALVKAYHEELSAEETREKLEAELKTLNDGLSQLLPCPLDVIYHDMTLPNIHQLLLHYEFKAVTSAWDFLTLEFYTDDNLIVALLPIRLGDFGQTKGLKLTQNSADAITIERLDKKAETADFGAEDIRKFCEEQQQRFSPLTEDFLRALRSGLNLKPKNSKQD